MKEITISQFAKKTNTTAVALRFYEKNGLIPPPSRSTSGYRQYSEKYLNRIAFIQNAQAVGFSLQEIKRLFDLQEDPALSSYDIRELSKTKLANIKQKIAILEKMQNSLLHLLDICDGTVPMQQCPILENLYYKPTKE